LTALLILALYLLGALVNYLLLRVMIRTLRQLRVSHGIDERHLILPSAIWPVTLMILSSWQDTDAVAWWEL
jgi:hypothetical protein